MKKSFINKRRLIASIMTVCFLAQQSLMLNAFATNISGVTGNNGVYNINPTDIKGNVGFRNYANFNLSEGDVANLIFKHGSSNLAKFVNLVDGKININGIVNTMRDGNFYNGQAIFVSPNGMVVGASGVLNVGSLAVYTPSSSDYRNYKNNYKTQDLNSIASGKADIAIDGKVISRSGIELLGRDVELGASSQVLAGVKYSSAITSSKQAENIFSRLVNIDVKNANSFAAENGKIVIKSDTTNGKVSTAGTIKNFGKGHITITNEGSHNTLLGGKIENANGNIIVTNNNGSLKVSGDISTKGNITMTNNGKNGAYIDGNISTKKGNILLTNNNNEMEVSGNITNENGATTIKNTASRIKISGNISNKGGNLLITNEGVSLDVKSDAKLSNDGVIRLLSSGSYGMTVNGEIENTKSTVITNKGGKLTVGAKFNTSGALNMNNSGAGMEITDESVVNHNGAVFVQNFGPNGAQFNGKIANSGNTTLLNYDGNMEVNGSIENSNGKLGITNKGDGALNFGYESSVANNSGTTTILNYGEHGTTVDGSILTNGNTTIINKDGGFKVNGTVYTKDGDLKLSNATYSFVTDKDSYIAAENGDLTIQNFGENGIIHNGQISSYGSLDDNNNMIAQSGSTTIINTKGGMVSNGDLTSGDKLIIKNNSNNLRLSGKTAAKRVDVTNTGSEGTIINGTVLGDDLIKITNKSGSLDIKEGNIITSGADGSSINITNDGTGLYIGEDAVISSTGDMLIKNSGSDGMTLNGSFDTKKFTAINNDGGLYINGKINNESDSVVISNYGTGISVGVNAEINNDKNIRFVNTGEKGTIISGKVTSTEDVVQFLNKEGELAIYGEVSDINKPSDSEE